MKIKIVQGPPCSGKSTYVNGHKGENDIIFDYDIMMAALTGKSFRDKNDNAYAYLMAIRETLIDLSEFDDDTETLWIITTRLNQDLKYRLEERDVAFIHMKATEQECLDRLVEDPDNRNIDETIDVIKKYFHPERNYYTPPVRQTMP